MGPAHTAMSASNGVRPACQTLSMVLPRLVPIGTSCGIASCEIAEVTF